MRALEAALLVANLLTFVALAVPQQRVMRWLRLIAPAGFGIAMAQMLVEGPRWQMGPAYVVTGALLLISLRKHRTKAVGAAAGPGGRRAAKRVNVGLGVLGVLGWVSAVTLPLAFPVFSFPHPTGPHAIGTVTYTWIDEARSEIFSADLAARRKLVVQIWYPAQSDSSSARAAYMPDAAAVTTAFARIHHLPAFAFGHFRYVTTNARPSAPVAAGKHGYPVLLFLEGATGYRQMNTFQIEELVSRGYIVAAVDQPGVAANVVYPDGHQTPGLTLSQFHPLVRPSYMPAIDAQALGAMLPNGHRLNDTSIIPYLAKDAIFTLDQLTALNQADPKGILTSKLDLQRVGAFGLSLGGIVVGEVCRLEPRVRACLVMDAPVSTDVVDSGLRQPSMWITRDVASMRTERQRTGGWPDAEINAHQATMRAAYEGLSGAGYFLRIPGMFHSNFTDIPAWTPVASWLGLTGPVDGRRAHELVNAYSAAFFDRHLAERSAPLLDAAAIHGPEVLFESRGP